MMTVVQGLRKDSGAGEPIPVPFGSFKRMGIHFRRGEFALIAAAPGGGKSALMQYIAKNSHNENGPTPTFYFSADSPSFTVFHRMGAMVTGMTMQEVEDTMKSSRANELREAVADVTSHIQYSFKSTLDPELIMDELEGYANVHGAWPTLIIIDNLMNIDMGSDGEIQNLADGSFFLNDLARDTGSAVVALHHVTGEHESGTSPIPLSGLRGKVSKLPSLILTLHRTDELKVSVVKNRSAQADPTGAYGVRLGCDLSRMRFSG